jgi:plasmid stability protein
MIAGEKKTTIAVILDRELRTRLERAAREHDRSVGGEVRAMLREHLGSETTDDETEADDGAAR